VRNWEAAQKIVRDWEIHGEENALSVKEAANKFLADAKARELKEPTLRKYKHVVEELKREWGTIALRVITVDDVRTLRQSWKLSGVSTAKRLEHIRSFFRFCVDSGWIEKNPAKAVKSPPSKPVPTLPFSDQEMEKILWAVDAYLEIHPQSTVAIQKKLKALILILRYAGLRISDAVVLTPEKIKGGKLFLYTQKTGTPVSCPLPKSVIEALAAAEDGGSYYFWSGAGKVKTQITEWQERLKKVFTIAGIPKGHGHRFRGYIRGITSRERGAAAYRFGPSRAHIDQNDREALRAVGEGASGCAGRGGEGDVVVAYLGHVKRGRFAACKTLLVRPNDEKYASEALSSWKCVTRLPLKIASKHWRTIELAASESISALLTPSIASRPGT
jgi:integrase